MNSRTLSMRMKDNYSTILNKLTAEERAWAEKFESLEYSLERGKLQEAQEQYEDLKGYSITKEEVKTLRAERESNRRCNPLLAAADAKAFSKARPRKTDRKSPDVSYDPSDFIDQRFNAGGYEMAVSLSPEDAIIEAIDAAKAANTTLSDILDGNATFTKPRGRGRPKNVKA